MFDYTYMVKVTTPVYHHSTDGYVGTRTVIDEAFSTYEEAVQHCWYNFNSHEVFEDAEVYARIVVMVTYDLGDNTYIKEYEIHQLNANSQYYGPCGYCSGGTDPNVICFKCMPF